VRWVFEPDEDVYGEGLVKCYGGTSCCLGVGGLMGICNEMCFDQRLIKEKGVGTESAYVTTGKQ